MKLTWLGTTAFAAAMLTTTLASGQNVPPAAQPSADSGVLRPSTRGTFVAFGIGPSFGLSGCNDQGCASATALTQLKLSQEIGFHVSGNGRGFALGVNTEEAFGDNLVRWQPGFKMWWDIQPDQDLALYIAPTLKLGYGLFVADTGAFGSLSAHTFNAQAGVEGRIVLGDRGMIFLKPFTLDTFVDDSGVLLTYDVLIGGAVTF